MGFMSGNTINVNDNGFMIKLSIAVACLFLIVYVAPIGVPPLAIPDETRYSEIPREMIASGDWAVPHLNGLRYFEKPAMGYWINALSIIAFGENGFAARFPSAAATGISALLLFFMARKFNGGYLSGILTASIFLTFFEVFAVGSFSVLDGPLSLFITSTMVLYFFAVMEINPRKKNLFLVLSGISCGLSFLTKGFLAFVLPLIVIVPFMAWERRIKDLLKSLCVPALSALLVSLPWAVLIHLREPDFWHFFFWNEHIKRFMAEGAQHKESFWYFFKLFPLATLPWLFLIPVAWFGKRKGMLNESIIRFSLCWFLFPFLFFSASSGKLPTYILPCFPPLAIILSVGLHNYLNNGREKAFNLGALLFALFICVIAIILLVFQINGFHGLKPYFHIWKLSLLMAGILSWVLFIMFSIRVPDLKKKILIFAAAPVLFLFAAHFCIPDLTIQHKMPGDFLLHHYDQIRQDSIIVSDEALISSICWFYKRSDIYLLGNYGEFQYGLNYEDSKYRHLEPDKFSEFVLKNKGAGLMTLIAKAKNYKGWRPYLPEPVYEYNNGEGGFIFAQF
jgi:4-amino-4-deoxy-L-arabinose transferase